MLKIFNPCICYNLNKGEIMIEIKNLTKKYGDFNAVDNISFKINDGEIFGFLGPNGAGKSSTIKMITGINKVTSGEVLIDDISIEKDPLKCKQNIGFVSDNVDVMLNLTGLEYLSFIANIYNLDEKIAKQRMVTLTKQFEIFDDLNNTISSYSHGMRQKICVCGVLLHNPKNWILDEPMTGLDPHSAHTLKQMMRKHANENNTVFFSTHVLEVAQNLCDKIGIINKGKMLFVGTLDELQQTNGNLTLEEIFLNMTEQK